MPNTLDERIAELVILKLEEISVDNGYTTDVENVFRPSEPIAPQEIAPDQCPALQVRKMSIRKRALPLRGAWELVIVFHVACVVAVEEGTPPDEDIESLKADVLKCLTANEAWDDGEEELAERSWALDDIPHEPEVWEKTASGVVGFEVLAYQDVTDPAEVKAI
jgi:hypothetical protein